MLLRRDQTQFIKEVLGVDSLVLNPDTSAISHASLKQEKKIVFLIPEGLSRAADELLQKIKLTVGNQLVETIYYQHQVGITSLDSHLSGIDFKCGLVFGEQLFSQLPTTKGEFFEHFESPVHWKERPFFSTHDLEKMIGDDKQVVTLKRHLWQQLKKVKSII